MGWVVVSRVHTPPRKQLSAPLGSTAESGVEEGAVDTADLGSSPALLPEGLGTWAGTLDPG